MDSFLKFFFLENLCVCVCVSEIVPCRYKGKLYLQDLLMSMSVTEPVAGALCVPHPLKSCMWFKEGDNGCAWLHFEQFH